VPHATRILAYASASCLISSCSVAEKTRSPDDTGDSAVEAAETGDTSARDDSGDSGGTAPGPDCEAPLSIDLVTTATPGSTVTVAASGGDAGVAYTWAVDAGTLSSDTGAAVDWALPADAATHVAETLDVMLTATEAGCEARSATASVTVDWPDAARTLVVYNPSVEGSQTVADYYAAFRGIDQLCAVPASDSTTLAGADYPAFLDAVLACVTAIGDHVHYIVPVYGVPYKVSDRIADLAYGTPATVSLDALLAAGADSVSYTAVDDNPMYRDGDSDSGVYDDYRPLGRLLNNKAAGWYVVTRIDGADADAAMDLVDRTEIAESLKGSLTGTVYVDGKMGDTPPSTDAFGSYEWGEWNMWGTRRIFEDLAWYPVVWDGNAEEFGTAPAPEECPDALYYAGWYSYYNYNDAFVWQPGAIGAHLDSCSACDLRSGTWSAEALKRGITATFGAVNEPYVAGMPEYDQFFLYLTQGADFGEAAYESTVVGLWMMVFVGDPLYRPYEAISN
jgi:uncharacterized protein (TIGR03790 family)